MPSSLLCQPLPLIVAAFTGFAFATAIWNRRRSPGAVSSAQAQLMIDAAAEKSFHDGMRYAAIRQGERTAAAVRRARGGASVLLPCDTAEQQWEIQ